MIAIASDHAGFILKDELVKWLRSMQFDVTDFGCFSTDSVDYPDVVHPLCKAMENDPELEGILLCGSGNGVAMTANKHPYIRAALVWNPEIASLAKKHNNANIICLPARFINFEMATSVFKAWNDAVFEGGRHLDRIMKIPC